MTDRPGEDELIARYFAPLAGPAGLGLKDDVALLTPPAGRDLVVTTDALVAGVHFFADDPPGAIARKALRVNLSDLAAKGAEPLGFLLNLALPADWTADWLDGLRRRARRRRGDLSLSADRRRHGQDAGAADAGDHRASARSSPAASPRAAACAPATGFTSPARSATPRSACACGSGRGRRSPTRDRLQSARPLPSAAAAAGSGARDGRASPAPGWTSPTASSAT